MKWFFAMTGLIFALFALCVGYGATLPDTRILERSQVLEEDVGSLYDIISDLRTHPDWSHRVPHGADLAIGQSTGMGASAAWSEATVGSIDILQTIPDSLVLATVQIDQDSYNLTYVLSPEDTQTILLIKEEQSLGGFPYLKRLRGKTTQQRAETDMDASLLRLTEIARDAAS